MLQTAPYPNLRVAREQASLSLDELASRAQVDSERLHEAEAGVRLTATEESRLVRSLGQEALRDPALTVAGALFRSTGGPADADIAELENRALQFRRLTALVGRR